MGTPFFTDSTISSLRFNEYAFMLFCLTRRSIIAICCQYNNLTMEREQVEGIDVTVLERPGELRTEVDPAELSHHLSNPRSLIWCDITGTEG